MWWRRSTRRSPAPAIRIQAATTARALESSLSRLKTDYIDLYWVHVWDPLTPVDELMRALDDQVRVGKVLYVGISDTPAWVVARANTLADFRGWSPFAGIQVEYSLIERTVERELVPMAHALDLAVLGWAPLGRGLLSGKYTADGPPAGEHARLSAGDRRLNGRNLAIVDAVKEVAGELGVRPAAVAIAWLLTRPGPAVIPIVGAHVAWLIAVHGRHSSWVRNLERSPRARLQVALRWRTGTASPLPLDTSTLAGFNFYARSGPRTLGIDPLLVRVDLDSQRGNGSSGRNSNRRSAVEPTA